MKTRAIVILSALLASAANLPGAVNILVIGSTHSYTEGEQRGAANPETLDAKAIADRLARILANDTTIKGGTNVVFEEVFRKRMLPTAVGGGAKLMNMEYRCHSLAQYYFWPDGRAKRLANLAGRGKTKWSYVVLVGDPYLLANMPGVYAEGVNLMAEAARKGRARPILLMPWPAGGTPDDAAHLAEVVSRVGQGTKIPVAPAGRAWTTLPAKDKSADGAYLAAACIYSEAFGLAAAGASASEKTLAAHALLTVKANKTEPQFTGRFEFASPFAMKYVAKRGITYNHTGSSSENGIQGALEGAIKRCGIACKKVAAGKAPGGGKIDFNYGRANSIFEPQKQYKVAPARFGRSYGFPMQEHGKTAAITMLYGIDKRYIGGRSYDDGTDLGIAYDMIRQGEVASDIRAVPIRLMWAKLRDASPKLKPLRDSWHMSRYLDEATASFMVTLLTGRCPVGHKPTTNSADHWHRWLGRKIGYETAMRMAHLQLPVR